MKKKTREREIRQKQIEKKEKKIRTLVYKRLNAQSGPSCNPHD